jgi:hypothetical protein
VFVAGVELVKQRPLILPRAEDCNTHLRTSIRVSRHIPSDNRRAGCRRA